jgi:hypothetical protein
MSLSKYNHLCYSTGDDSKPKDGKRLAFETASGRFINKVEDEVEEKREAEDEGEEKAEKDQKKKEWQYIELLNKSL